MDSRRYRKYVSSRVVAVGLCNVGGVASEDGIGGPVPGQLGWVSIETVMGLNIGDSSVAGGAENLADHGGEVLGQSLIVSKTHPLNIVSA